MTAASEKEMKTMGWKHVAEAHPERMEAIKNMSHNALLNETTKDWLVNQYRRCYTKNMLLTLVLRSRASQGRAIVAVCLVGIMLALDASPCYSQSPTKIPTIKSISGITTQQYQTIVIRGSGFGTLQPYTGNSAYISFLDTTKVWQAGFVGYLSGSFCGGPGSGDDAVTLIVNTWDNSKITLGGFAGAWGENNWTLNKGDVENVCVWNAQSGDGPAEITTTIHGQAPTTTLSSSLNPSAYGQPVTLTAMVTSNDDPPPDGETVTFMRGETVLGTGTLREGSASFTTSTLTVGTHSITAVYGGDSDYEGNTSKAVKQVVGEAAN
jgi:hypothetical protein